MIKSVKIENFKSIAELELPLGRVNVLIGENGAGKSNILEAITLFFAGCNNKLDDEFLRNRGVRMTKPEFMRSGFTSDTHADDVKITVISSDNFIIPLSLTNNNEQYSEWLTLKKPLVTSYASIISQLKSVHESLKESEKKNDKTLIESSLDQLNAVLDTVELIENVLELSDFLIYSPEETSIRRFETEGQIQPLGRNGEGLLKLISVMYEQGDEERINELKENLRLVSWFEDFDFSTKPFERDMYLKIKDRYIDQELEFLDQRSSNEGFLYLLFYLTLFISDKTPKFFAIDNIDNALNPKLCIQLMKVLVKLAKKHDKQVIFTTHNPAILDGLDISDPEQKLLVVSRKRSGETKVTEISEKPRSGEKLSESFMSGMLGGLPKNF